MFFFSNFPISDDSSLMNYSKSKNITSKKIFAERVFIELIWRSYVKNDFRRLFSDLWLKPKLTNADESKKNGNEMPNQKLSKLLTTEMQRNIFFSSFVFNSSQKIATKYLILQFMIISSRTSLVKISSSTTQNLNSTSSIQIVNTSKSFFKFVLFIQTFISPDKNDVGIKKSTKFKKFQMWTFVIKSLSFSAKEVELEKVFEKMMIKIVELNSIIQEFGSSPIQKKWLKMLTKFNFIIEDFDLEKENT